MRIKIENGVEVSKFTLHGRKIRNIHIDLSKMDPDAPPPSPKRLQDLIQELRMVKPVQFSHSRRIPKK